MNKNICIEITVLRDPLDQNSIHELLTYLINLIGFSIDNVSTSLMRVTDETNLYEFIDKVYSRYDECGWIEFIDKDLGTVTVFICNSNYHRNYVSLVLDDSVNAEKALDMFRFLTTIWEGLFGFIQWETKILYGRKLGVYNYYSKKYAEAIRLKVEKIRKQTEFIVTESEHGYMVELVRDDESSRLLLKQIIGKKYFEHPAKYEPRFARVMTGKNRVLIPYPKLVSDVQGFLNEVPELVKQFVPDRPVGLNDLGALEKYFHNEEIDQPLRVKVSVAVLGAILVNEYGFRWKVGGLFRKKPVVVSKQGESFDPYWYLDEYAGDRELGLRKIFSRKNNPEWI